MATASNKKDTVPMPTRNNRGIGQAVFVAVSSVILYLLVNPPAYKFDPETMLQISRKAIAEGQAMSATPNQTDVRVIVDSVVRQLDERYPGKILPNRRWMFNNAGGAMGSMLVLHCSLVEYVIIFGTALGTEGHTGRFMADDYFTILSGEQWAFESGSLTKEVYRPGDQHLMPRGVAKQYKMPDAAWALEYARGNILSMLPFGFADALSSTLDFQSLGNTIYISAYGVIRELIMS